MPENEFHKQSSQDGNEPAFSSNVNPERGIQLDVSSMTETVTRGNIVALIEGKKGDVSKIYGESEKAKEVTDVLNELINDIRAQRNSTVENSTSED